jgi:hypothetical protein
VISNLLVSFADAMATAANIKIEREINLSVFMAINIKV